MRQHTIRLAVDTLRHTRGRSFLTMFGIIIGVMAVVVTLGIGEGVKVQVAGQLNQLKSEVVVVRPGVNETNITTNGALDSLRTAVLNSADLETVQQTPGVEQAVPLATVGGFAEVNGQRQPGGLVLATTSDLPDMLDREVQFGTFFTEGEQNRGVAVIGAAVAQDLFGENVPIGRTLTVRGKDYIVRGVFENFATAPTSVGTDLNRAVFIPLPAANEASGSALPLAQILVNPTANTNQQTLVSNITQRLSAAHGGQQDFTVLDRQTELQTNSQLITLLTQMITAIAGIALVVGGIGIINIMFVSVTERTREIGIRKAVGATNRQIRQQFVVEAITLTVVGGLFGVLFSLLALFVIGVLTPLEPVVPFVAMGAVLIGTVVLGIVCGVAPAIAAARKEPIEALRYE